MARSLLVVALAVLAFAGSSQGLVKNYTLDSFTGVDLQLPLYGQVNVTSGSNYSATIDAVDDLVTNASVAVSDGVLVIDLLPNAVVTAQYTTPQTISIVVPANTLSSFSLSSSSALTVDGATVSPKAALTTDATGIGSLIIANATASGVTSQASGQGVTVVTGNLGAVSYTASGQGSGYFMGNVTAAAVSLTGQGNVFVSSAAAPAITGTSVGQTAVFYDQGTCTVSGVGSSPCQQQKNITLPPPVTAPTSGSISISKASSPSGSGSSISNPSGSSSATVSGSGSGTVSTSSGSASG